MAYKSTEKQREYQRLWRRNQIVKRRQTVIDLLGGKCIDCGNSDIRVLQIDHKIPVLRTRKDSKYGSLDSGARLTDKIIIGKEALDNFELRCANCHQIKSYEQRKQLKNYIL